MEKINDFLGRVIPALSLGVVVGVLMAICLSVLGIPLFIGELINSIEVIPQENAYECGFVFIVVSVTLWITLAEIYDL